MTTDRMAGVQKERERARASSLHPCCCNQGCHVLSSINSLLGGSLVTVPCTGKTGCHVLFMPSPLQEPETAFLRIWSCCGLWSGKNKGGGC